MSSKISYITIMSDFIIKENISELYSYGITLLPIKTDIKKSYLADYIRSMDIIIVKCNSNDDIKQYKKYKIPIIVWNENIHYKDVIKAIAFLKKKYKFDNDNDNEKQIHIHFADLTEDKNIYSLVKKISLKINNRTEPYKNSLVYVGKPGYYNCYLNIPIKEAISRYLETQNDYITKMADARSISILNYEVFVTYFDDCFVTYSAGKGIDMIMPIHIRKLKDVDKNFKVRYNKYIKLAMKENRNG